MDIELRHHERSDWRSEIKTLCRFGRSAEAFEKLRQRGDSEQAEVDLLLAEYFPLCPVYDFLFQRPKMQQQDQWRLPPRWDFSLFALSNDARYFELTKAVLNRNSDIRHRSFLSFLKLADPFKRLSRYSAYTRQMPSLQSTWLPPEAAEAFAAKVQERTHKFPHCQAEIQFFLHRHGHLQDAPRPASPLDWSSPWVSPATLLGPQSMIRQELLQAKALVQAWHPLAQYRVLIQLRSPKLAAPRRQDWYRGLQDLSQGRCGQVGKKITLFCQPQEAQALLQSVRGLLQSFGIKPVIVGAQRSEPATQKGWQAVFKRLDKLYQRASNETPGVILEDL